MYDPYKFYVRKDDKPLSRTDQLIVVAIEASLTLVAILTLGFVAKFLWF